MLIKDHSSPRCQRVIINTRVILDAELSVTPGMTRAPEASGHHTSGIRAEAEQPLIIYVSPDLLRAVITSDVV